MMLVGQHRLFRAAVDKIGDDAVHAAAVAFDEHARLPGGDELRVDTASLQAGGDFHRGPILPRYSRWHGMDSQACLADPTTLGHVVLGAASQVDKAHPLPPRGSAELAGRRRRKSCKPEITSSLRWIASRTIGRQESGSLPPGGAMPISRALPDGASASEPTTGIAPPTPSQSWQLA